MGTITKIKSVSLTKMNNAEYVNFMKRFRDLIKEKTSGGDDRPEIESLSDVNNSLGITDRQLADFDTDLALLADLVNESRISDETALLLGLDKKRDDLVVYFTSSVSQMTKSPVEAQQAAAQLIYNRIKSYIGIYSLPNQQETQQIEGLLLDMAKEENASQITVLGLKPVLDELQETNKQYAELTSQRTNNKALSVKENSTAVRKRMDILYDDMITMAFVQSVAAPTAETAAFVANINALIAETSALYNQRVAVSKAGNKGKDNHPGEDDRPVIE